MIFIDANIFLAFENEDDVHHHQAKKLFEDIDQGKHGKPFTSDYVFNEVVGVIFRKKGKDRAVSFGDYIRASVFILVIDEHILLEAWDLLKSTPLKLNFVDCSNVIVVGITSTHFIATFDKEFAKVKSIKVIP